jgi:hypothetical protein
MPGTEAVAVNVPACVEVTERVTVCGPGNVPTPMEARFRSLGSLGSASSNRSSPSAPSRYEAQSAAPLRYSRPGLKYYVGST